MNGFNNEKLFIITPFTSTEYSYLLYIACGDSVTACLLYLRAHPSNVYLH
jgi:hypothetical protein